MNDNADDDGVEGVELGVYAGAGSEPPAMLLTYEEAAHVLSVSRRQLEDMVHRKEVPHLKIGRIVRFSRAALAEWITDNMIWGLPHWVSENVLQIPKLSGRNK